MLCFKRGNFELLFCCAESEAKSASERNNSNQHDRRAQTWFLQTCVWPIGSGARGWKNVCGSLECTQEADGHLSCNCTSNHVGFAWCVYGGLCTRLNQNKAGIVFCVLLRIQWQMLAKSYKQILKRCSLAQAMTSIDYIFHSTIKTFLDATSLDPLAVGKRKRENYSGTSSDELQILITKKWFGWGKMLCSSFKQVKEVFRSANVARRQEATLG